MENDRSKAQLFLGQYEEGLRVFKMPIDEVIAVQLSSFRVACEASEELARP
jgi:hypothetical protein